MLFITSFATTQNTYSDRLLLTWLKNDPHVLLPFIGALINRKIYNNLISQIAVFPSIFVGCGPLQRIMSNRLESPESIIFFAYFFLLVFCLPVTNGAIKCTWSSRNYNKCIGAVWRSARAFGDHTLDRPQRSFSLDSRENTLVEMQAELLFLRVVHFAWRPAFIDATCRFKMWWGICLESIWHFT